jgi:hypothetical protein
MPRRALCISFSDPPPRPRRLSESELSHVFGSCAGYGEPCSKDNDCCPVYPVWRRDSVQPICHFGRCVL